MVITNIQLFAHVESTKTMTSTYVVDLYAELKTMTSTYYVVDLYDGTQKQNNPIAQITAHALAASNTISCFSCINETMIHGVIVQCALPSLAPHCSISFCDHSIFAHNFNFSRHATTKQSPNPFSKQINTPCQKSRRNTPMIRTISC